jgi:Ca2+-binding EF-hand superfamily protein
MRKLTLTLSVAALALSGTGIAAYAQGKQTPDTNGDGLVSLAEAKAQAATHFARMDVNKDGQIDKADREAMQAKRFAAADTNGDGELTQAEMKAAHEAHMAKRADKRADRQAERFAKMDTDNSGGISEAEMAAAHEARGKMRGERQAEMRGQRGERQQGMHQGHRVKRGPGKAMAMLRQADANKDMIVTRAEFDASVEARFARVDTDKSGTISAEERKAAREKMREMRQERRGQRAR